MNYIDNLLFGVLLFIGVGFFVKNIKKLSRNIKLGKKIDRTDNADARLKNMLMVAMGQSKMVKRPMDPLNSI